ncbi:MAG: class I SAM-dependent methyltransferase [bacterium]
MDIKKSLANFYDAQAEKYAQTRNKHRSDADIFLNALQTYNKKTIRILEFGCGSGRLLSQLSQLKDIKINYTGIDISKNLLSFAKKQIPPKSTHIKATFLCDDIVHAITTFPQESFDFVIGIASFQHIPTPKERFFLTKNIYRILDYQGKCIMTNRSFSSWFIGKYKKALCTALRKYIYSLGKYERNNILIPRKNGKTTSQRFYHIYTLRELKKLITMSGFIIENIGYIDNQGMIIPDWKISKNSLVIASKSIFLQTEEN